MSYDQILMNQGQVGVVHAGTGGNMPFNGQVGRTKNAASAKSFLAEKRLEREKREALRRQGRARRARVWAWLRRTVAKRR